MDPQLEARRGGRQERERARPQLGPHADARQAVQLALLWRRGVGRQARIQPGGQVRLDLAEARGVDQRVVQVQHQAQAALPARRGV